MGSVGGFVPTPQGVGNGYSEAPQNLIGGVYDLPIVGGGGSSYSSGYNHFNGPTESLAEVMEKINIFYEGFNYKITV